MTYYIQDSTRNTYVYFNTLKEIVSYLEQMIGRAMKLTRAQYMENVTSLGYGADDTDGVTFIRSLGEQFNIGVVKKDGTLRKCDIVDATVYNKDEYGD